MATSSVGATGSQTGTQSSTSSSGSAYDSLNVDTFTKLLVAELQNQDPMSPMDSSQIVQQIAEIRSIQSNTDLSNTLQAVLLGQNVSTASSMIGRTISGTAEDSSTVTGQVDSVTIANGTAQLHIGDATVDLNSVSEILPDGSTN